MAPYSSGCGYHGFVVVIDELPRCKIYQSNGSHTRMFEIDTTYDFFLSKYNEIELIKQQAMALSFDEVEVYLDDDDCTKKNELLSLFRRIVLLERELYHHDIFKVILYEVIIEAFEVKISISNPVLENFHPENITTEAILQHFEVKKSRVDPQEFDDYNGEVERYEVNELPVLRLFFDNLDEEKIEKIAEVIRKKIVRAILNYRKDRFTFRLFKHVSKTRKTRKKTRSFDSYKRKSRRTKSRSKIRTI